MSAFDPKRTYRSGVACLCSKASRNDRRVIFKRVGQCPQQEQHDRQMEKQLQERKAYQIARA
jgi:hypothetical protein